MNPQRDGDTSSTLSLSPPSDSALEPGVISSISAEIAAALAQAQVRALAEDDEDDENAGNRPPPSKRSRARSARLLRSVNESDLMEA